MVGRGRSTCRSRFGSPDGLPDCPACGLIGNYLILRRMALVGDAIGHSVLPGLAIAFLRTA